MRAREGQGSADSTCHFFLSQIRIPACFPIAVGAGCPSAGGTPDGVCRQPVAFSVCPFLIHYGHAFFPKADFLLTMMGFLRVSLLVRPAWAGADWGQRLGLCEESPGGPHGNSPRPGSKGASLAVGPPAGLEGQARLLKPIGYVS